MDKLNHRNPLLAGSFEVKAPGKTPSVKEETPGPSGEPLADDHAAAAAARAARRRERAAKVKDRKKRAARIVLDAVDRAEVVVVAQLGPRLADWPDEAVDILLQDLADRLEVPIESLGDAIPKSPIGGHTISTVTAWVLGMLAAWERR